MVARYRGGTITAGELQRESARLPPALREQFETVNGRREFVNALIDRRLLFEEARRLELTEDPEVRRQVRELEERLAVQALLAAEERKVGAPTEAEARAWYGAHPEAFRQPERRRVVRVLAAVPRGASERVKAEARARAGRFVDRLARGEDVAAVARDGDGPERARAGDIGLVARGEGREAALVNAVFALGGANATSGVVQLEDGFAALRVVESLPERSPPFEEVRAGVMNRMEPQRKRQALDRLLGSLRKDAGIRLELEAGPR